MVRNSVTVNLSKYLKKEADKFVGEKKTYTHISNLIDDAVRRRLEELKRLMK